MPSYPRLRRRVLFVLRGKLGAGPPIERELAHIAILDGPQQTAAREAIPVH